MKMPATKMNWKQLILKATRIGWLSSFRILAGMAGSKSFELGYRVDFSLDVPT